mgnify:CR=1 FL=1
MDRTPKPCNRHLVVDPLDPENQDKEASAILLPEEYSNLPIYGQGRVLAQSADCTVDVIVGEIVVYQNSMLEEIDVGTKKYNLILENYILCVA